MGERGVEFKEWEKGGGLNGGIWGMKGRGLNGGDFEEWEKWSGLNPTFGGILSLNSIYYILNKHGSIPWFS